ncbi:MAG: hypothetical protein [Bacteriophage sp.]|nr:MAG: hypothetical protein [Bacteriophage sp.]
MSITPDKFALEISNALAATGEDYTTTAVDLGVYGTSYTVTKSGTDRELYLTPVEDGLIDMALFDEGGSTIASGTLFHRVVDDITPEKLASLVSICL